MQEVEEEGQNAIDSSGLPAAVEAPPEEYALGELFIGLTGLLFIRGFQTKMRKDLFWRQELLKTPS